MANTSSDPLAPKPNQTTSSRTEQPVSTPLTVSTPSETREPDSTNHHTNPIDHNGSPSRSLNSNNHMDDLFDKAQDPKNKAQNSVMGSFFEPPKSRGRPKGSKNRPKSSMDFELVKIRPMDHDIGPKPITHVLSIPVGVDIVETVRDLARHKKSGVTIHHGTGQVKGVTFESELGILKSNITHDGPFRLITINGVHVGPASPKIHVHGSSHGSNPYLSGAYTSIAVIAKGPDETRVLGHIVGPLLAASTVHLHVTTFESYEFHDIVHLGHSTTPIGSTSGADPSTGGLDHKPKTISSSQKQSPNSDK